MRKIDTLDDLRKEKVRLKIHLRTLEVQMDEDVQRIKHSLKPAHLVLNKVNSIFMRENNGFLNLPINGGIDFIFRKVLLRNSGFITKLILPFIAKNLANNYFSETKGDILSWLGGKVKSIFTKNHDHSDRKDHTENNYQEEEKE